ncbi:hypothetical protein Pukovnik_40 [Mycobacterium phage Pukovnik]|uniref:Uncharacterized protein n=1 Tax=Mycobacterium phage Pukovnik TaxID=2914013 RepID=B3VGI9_9CAUD|nr:hypothetical protein Pukovnik_40 [Mycobacterium phage Pukovnik]ACE79966.1 hypothetical protein Pukovnik_40 [Mycobacterium phage Pukovnik]
MSLGQKFAVVQAFTEEMVAAFPEEYILRHVEEGFRHAMRKHPEVVVPFEHTIRIDVQRDFTGRHFMVRTQAMVIRAQLAIES